jgi:hypothetical protein
MDDLAGLVMKQLQLGDGAGPYALVHVNWNRKRALVATAKRTNGVVHYAFAHVDVDNEHYDATHEGERRVKWEFVNYTDVDAAAYFGMAFMVHRHSVETRNPKTTFLRNLNMHKIFEPGPDGAHFLPIEHNRGIGYGFTRFAEELGTATNPDVTTLRMGLLALMPTGHGMNGVFF